MWLQMTSSAFTDLDGSFHSSQIITWLQLVYKQMSIFQPLKVRLQNLKVHRMFSIIQPCAIAIDINTCTYSMYIN